MPLVIKTSKAKMPASCYGSGFYYHIAVMDVKNAEKVTSIDIRHNNTLAIIEDSGPLFRGQTKKSVYYQELNKLSEKYPNAIIV